MIEAIRTRRSIRSYLARDVDDKALSEVLASAMCAPTSWGTRAWEFIVVRDKMMKKRLSEATSHATFVKDAPVVVVIAYDPKKGRRFKEDSSICAAHMMLEAEAQGLSTCFVQVADAGEPAGSAEPYVKGLLGVPETMRVLCMLPIGYAKRRLKPNDGKLDEAKVHRERY